MCDILLAVVVMGTGLFSFFVSSVDFLSLVTTSTMSSVISEDISVICSGVRRVVAGADEGVGLGGVGGSTPAATGSGSWVVGVGVAAAGTSAGVGSAWLVGEVGYWGKESSGALIRELYP